MTWAVRPFSQLSQEDTLKIEMQRENLERDLKEKIALD